MRRRIPDARLHYAEVMFAAAQPDIRRGAAGGGVSAFGRSAGAAIGAKPRAGV